MSSALLRRLKGRRELVAAHLARPDLVRYVDEMPRLVSSGAVYEDGRMVRPSRQEMEARLIPGGTLRLVALSGLGDAIWTRGVVRETLKAGLRVCLDTPHEWVFWDFEGQPGFSFWRRESSPEAYGIRTATYLGRDLRDGQTIYGAMCERCRVAKGEFRMALKPEWVAAAEAVLRDIAPRKPLMIYRPLVRNHGRRSVTSRNPDHAAYVAVYAAIRERYHVVSVATDGAGESIVHADAVDTVFHRGELPVTTLCALMARAALVYTNPGMALVVAAALGTPVIGVFGGYEDAHNYRDTVVYGPSLLLEPVRPCRCMSDSHACDKRMDVEAAARRAQDFCASLGEQHE